MGKYSLFFLLLLLTPACRSQTDAPAVSAPYLVGGPCEGCEAVLEYGDRPLGPVDTLPAFAEAERRMKVTGTIYQADGKTSAEGIILYIYHTNPEGVYEAGPDARGWERRHGYRRGWIRTGADGKYTFYTHFPGAYGNNYPHVHPTILEPDGKYYYLSEYHLVADSAAYQAAREKEPVRGGGTGVVLPREEGELLVVERDLVLGENVPGYGS